MGPLEFVLYFALGAIGLIYLLGRNNRKNYPPGPWGFPILGHLPLMGLIPHLQISKWSKKYGPIMSIEFGSFPCVIISDAKLIKAAFNENDFAGRSDIRSMADRSGGQVKGLIFTEGKEWVEQRRFALRTLRDFGFGKKSMESAVHEEIKDLIETFKKSAGKPQSTKNAFNAAVLNALWTLIAGERFKQDDPDLAVAVKTLTSNVENINPLGYLSVFIPFLAKYAPNLFGYTKLMEGEMRIVNFVKKPVDYHISTWQNGQPRDFIDVYLDEIEKTVDKTSSFYKDEGRKSILFAVLDLFTAGAETTSSTLLWTFLYMAKFPQVQEKMQLEISKVVGNSRLPSLADRPSMPYTEAVIHEVMRYSSVFPIGLMHNAVRDVEFHGYIIPKDTMIIGDFYSVHFDEKIWDDPKTFKPERFLNKDGDFVRPGEGFMPFSNGKRVCLGETLARDELFLFTTCLFQTFNVQPESSVEELSLEPHAGAILTPQPHKLILTERN
jgi:cytochrome P450